MTADSAPADWGNIKQYVPNLPLLVAHIRIKDVEALVLNSIGDTDKLKEILRAMRRGEVISESEHDYVQKLLNATKEPKDDVPWPKLEELDASHDDIVKSVSQEKKQGRIKKIAKLGRIRGRGKNQDTSNGGRISKKKIIVFAFVIIILAGVIYGSTQISFVTTIDPPPPPPPAPSFVLPDDVMFGIDQTEYSNGDIILLSGRGTPSAEVDLVITDRRVILWNEQVVADAQGEYATIVIAGGNGWMEGATYIVTASHGSDRHIVEFLFEAP